jgi:hypothetical protein
MSRFRILLDFAAVFALAATFAAPPAYAVKNSYDVSIVVSDGFISAPHTDLHLVNGWGIAFNPKFLQRVGEFGLARQPLGLKSRFRFLPTGGSARSIRERASAAQWP